MKNAVMWLIARLGEGSSHAGIGLLAGAGYKFVTASTMPDKIVAGIMGAFGVIAIAMPDKGQQIAQAEANVVKAVADGLVQAQKK